MKCNLCESERGKVLYQAADYPDTRGGAVVQCKNCGLVFRQWGCDKVYNAIEQRTANALSEYPVEFNEKRRVIFSTIIEEMEPFRVSNRILDVGSGEGHFLNLCSQKNWHVFGVEANSGLAECCRNLYGIDVTKVRFEESNFPEDFFDVVAFMNVLEHMEDPFLALKKAHRIIRPGGAILMRFPNGAPHVRGRQVACVIYRMVKSVRRFDFFTISSYAFNAKSILTYLNRADFVGCKISNDNSWALQQAGEKIILGKLGKNLALKTIEWLDKFSEGAWLLAPSLLVRGTKKRV